MVKPHECTSCIWQNAFYKYSLITIKCPHKNENITGCTFKRSRLQLCIFSLIVLIAIVSSYIYVEIYNKMCEKGARFCLVTVTEILFVCCGNIYALNMIINHKLVLKIILGWDYLLKTARKYNLSPLLTEKQYKSLKFGKCAMEYVTLVYTLIFFAINLWRANYSIFDYIRNTHGFAFVYFILEIVYQATQKRKFQQYILNTFLNNLKNVLDNQKSNRNQFIINCNKLNRLVRFNLLLNRSIMLDGDLLRPILFFFIPIFTFGLAVILFTEICELFYDELTLERKVSVELFIMFIIMSTSLTWTLFQYDLIRTKVSREGTFK